MDKQERTDTQSNVAQFLADLNELSQRHGVGLTGEPVLFLMERDDYERTYRTDEASRLEFV